MKRKWIEFLYWMLKKEYYGKQIDKRGFVFTKWFLLRQLVDIRKQSDIWEYGKLNNLYARRHKKKGNVQFIIFHKGDQKYVDGIGHKSHKWIDFNSTWWKNFSV